MSDDNGRHYWCNVLVPAHDLVMTILHHVIISSPQVPSQHLLVSKDVLVLSNNPC
jgi:hypothetical protein